MPTKRKHKKKKLMFEYDVMYGPGPNKFYDIVEARNLKEAKKKANKLISPKITRRKKR